MSKRTKILVWLVIGVTLLYFLYHSGKYTVERMKSPFKYFTWSEFDSGAMPSDVADPEILTHKNTKGKNLLTGSGEANMDKNFIFALDTIREKVGFPIVIVAGNGYRSDAYNAHVGGVPRSSHRRIGEPKVKAADLYLPTYEMKQAVAEAAIELGITRFGWGTGTLLHIDNDLSKSQDVVWGYGGAHPSFSDLTSNLA